MKIGLIGNINNNNFSIMRYFRDLGADAHLLLDATDGKWQSSQFQPEADTWDIKKWSPFIHQTDIPNAPVAAFDLPLSLLLSYRSLFRSKMGLQDGWVKHVSKKQIFRAYAHYDLLIGSGISPATLSRARIDLDIFYPYSTGVEYFKTLKFAAQHAESSGISRLIFNKIVKRQIAGIKNARTVLNVEFGITNDILFSIGVKPHAVTVPLVYVERVEPGATKILPIAIPAINNTEFTILHHSRLMWKKPATLPKQDWAKQTKNNDWLFRAFSALKNERKNLKARLIVIEYGPDVEATKQLASELGIDAFIDWLPKMDRREILCLLQHVSVGVGEFCDVSRAIWGGTGWEVLACGKPLLQQMNFEDDEFNLIYGYQPPPMLPVRKEKDVLKHLVDMVDHPEKAIAIGHGAKEWFNRYNGIGLAKQWLNLLLAPHGFNARKSTERKGLHG